MTIYYCGIRVVLREVVLRDKPEDLLQCSPKGTVPVLILADGKVLDESLDIMMWALKQNDKANWLLDANDAQWRDASQLIAENDQRFKSHLDRYKYADRYPAYSQDHYRSQGEVFLNQLEQRLSCTPYLLGEHITFADVAIFPFIRQFAFVDEAWFFNSPYQQLQNWLDKFLHDKFFLNVMGKLSPWRPGDRITLFP